MASQTKKVPPKGILKKPTARVDSSGADTVASPSSSPPASSAQKKKKKKKKPDPRDVAIQHAKIIHDRRTLEDTITDSIILLAKLPTTLPDADPDADSSPPPSPSPSPSPSSTTTAAELFTSHIRLFQPSDYDALIEERNALGSCGYCLCPRPRPQKRSGPGAGAGAGEYKILNWGRADFAIARRAEVERWCSRGCARRAMYVKVQLGETAAWERAGIESIRIELLEEEEEKEKEKEQKQKQKQKEGTKNKSEEEEEEEDAAAVAAVAAATMAREMENLRLRDETDRRQKAAQAARDLALERGDTDAEKAAKRSVDVTIREKKVITGVREPSLAPGGEDHLVLDGYKTKFDPKSETMAKGTTITAKASDGNQDKPAEG